MVSAKKWIFTSAALGLAVFGGFTQWGQAGSIPNCLANEVPTINKETGLKSCIQAMVTQGLDEFPEHVYFRDGSQDFGFENYYVLRDGKIWVKPNKQTSGVDGEWKLFDGTGVPFGDKAKSFGKDDRVVSFSSEGLFIMAVSSTGRMYCWQPTIDKHTVWQDVLGAPTASDLIMPKNSGWSFSLSVVYAPYKRLTPMHDIDSYYEDIDGNKVEFGLTATSYVVDPDGQRIRYWDTGLPPSWGKAFASPERGKFVIKGMSASGSTIFVADESGKMYTRMMDYEMNGSPPGLRYTYEHTHRTDKVQTLFEAIRSLPVPDWREHPAIVLEGDAAITGKITIRMTGEGNAGRELRVQGRDSTGKYGYYFKPIFADVWSFQETGEVFSDAASVKVKAAERTQGRPMDKDYSGKMSVFMSKDVKADLLGFYYYNTPSTLRITTKSGKTFDLILHTVDLWSQTAQQKYTPELIGSPIGEPKLLSGTIEIPQDVLESKEPEVKELLEHYFLGINKLVNFLTVAATDEKVQITGHRIQRESTAYMDYRIGRKIDISVSRKLDPSEAIELKDAYTFLASMSELEFDHDDALTKDDLPVLKQKLEMNKEALKKVKKIRRARFWHSLARGLIGSSSSVIFEVVNGIISIFDIVDKHQLSGGISLKGGDVLLDYQGVNYRLAFSGSQDYSRAKDILNARIDKLKGQIKSLQK